ncbi:hypothetical protein [Photorhabdus sp. RM323S]|uniref:hypothetical protein n=1 Tax=Photorhabdus sp. RM323S TaxID=3342828 RepID=UPI0036DAD699
MYLVKIKWLSEQNGGRKNPPPARRYFAVSRFSEDIKYRKKEKQENSWNENSFTRYHPFNSERI